MNGVVMTVTLRQLEAFVAVAETSNFTRASERLGMAQPMVSGLVRELEREIGFRLFDRTTRRVRPTDAAAAPFDRGSVDLSRRSDPESAPARGDWLGAAD